MAGVVASLWLLLRGACRASSSLWPSRPSYEEPARPNGLQAVGVVGVSPDTGRSETCPFWCPVTGGAGDGEVSTHGGRIRVSGEGG